MELHAVEWFERQLREVLTEEQRKQLDGLIEHHHERPREGMRERRDPHLLRT